MQLTAAAFARKAEVLLIDAMKTASTAVTAGDALGARPADAAGRRGDVRRDGGGALLRHRDLPRPAAGGATPRTRGGGRLRRGRNGPAQRRRRAHRVAPLILEGDNLPHLRALEDGVAQMVYADPPFNTGRTQTRRSLTTVGTVNGDGDVEFTVADGTSGFTDYTFEVTAAADVAAGQGTFARFELPEGS